MKLRYYQKDAFTSVIENANNGKTDNLVVIPVGGGKSIVIGHLALWGLEKFSGKKVLAITHRKELSKQNAQKINTINPSIHLGFEKAEEKCPKDANIMMASIQTVGRDGLPRIREWADPKDISMILIDEAHHIPGGKTYQRLLEDIRLENPQIIVVGFTATPKRGDGERIDKYIANVAYEVSMAELVDNGFLARLRGIKVKTETSMAEFIGDKKKDFEDAKLDKLINNAKRNRLALDVYLAKHQGEQGLAFCVSKAHANDVAELFLAHGIKAAAITEDTPPKVRDQLIEDFKSGKINFLTSCMTLTEGFDAPLIKFLFMLRPTKSPVLFEQCLGRGLRLYATPDPKDPEAEWLIDWEKKSFCTVYDFVDQKATEAGAYNLAKMLDLNPEFDMEGEDAFAIKARIQSETEADPILAAALAQAHSLEEIDTLLQSHNILAELQSIHYVPDQKCSWMEMGQEESWIQLPQGETARVFKNALGAYELDGGIVPLEPRRIAQEKYRESQPDKSLPPVPEGETISLQHIPLTALNLSDALKEATEKIFELLPCDRPLLNKDAKWKEDAKSQPCTEGQRRMLVGKLKIPIHEEDLPKITKREANDLIEKALLQEELMRTKGRLTFGKYKGTPAHLINLYHPGYLLWMQEKRADSLRQNSCTEIVKAAQSENPLPWLKSFRPKLYQKDFAGMEEFYEKAFQADPEDVRKTIIFALDNDTIPPWPQALSRSENPPVPKRLEEILPKTENKITGKKPKPKLWDPPATPDFSF